MEYLLAVLLMIEKTACSKSLAGWLAYRVALRGGWIFLKAQLLDADR